jgi:hypothetical protein
VWVGVCSCVAVHDLCTGCAAEQWQGSAISSTLTHTWGNRVPPAGVLVLLACCRWALILPLPAGVHFLEYMVHTQVDVVLVAANVLTLYVVCRRDGRCSAICCCALHTVLQA